METATCRTYLLTEACSSGLISANWQGLAARRVSILWCHVTSSESTRSESWMTMLCQHMVGTCSHSLQTRGTWVAICAHLRVELKEAVGGVPNDEVRDALRVLPASHLHVLRVEVVRAQAEGAVSNSKDVVDAGEGCERCA